MSGGCGVSLSLFWGRKGSRKRELICLGGGFFFVADYCATNGGVGSPRSYCTGSAFGSAFQPAISIMQDVPTKYEAALNRVLPDTVFTADDYLGRFTKVAVSARFVVRGALADAEHLSTQTYLVFIGAILVRRPSSRPRPPAHITLTSPHLVHSPLSRC
jgi:hypothetical protein